MAASSLTSENTIPAPASPGSGQALGEIYALGYQARGILSQIRAARTGRAE